MNKTSIQTAKGYLPRVASIILILCSAALTISAARAQGGARAEWPKAVPYDAAIHAFDATLTKAVRDPAFRARLTKSPDSAKQAVEEVGNINIPSDRVIVFYEPQAAPSPNAAAGLAQPAAAALAQPALALNWGSRSNENIHVFVLPPRTADATKDYHYEDYMMCCYQAWRQSTPRTGH
jgi:hypothetical protein